MGWGKSSVLTDTNCLQFQKAKRVLKCAQDVLCELAHGTSIYNLIRKTFGGVEWALILDGEIPWNGRLGSGWNLDSIPGRTHSQRNILTVRLPCPPNLKPKDPTLRPLMVKGYGTENILGKKKKSKTKTKD